MKTVILGLGNPLRSDDGVGVAIVDALRKSQSLSEAVALIDGGISELDALLLMQEFDRVFILDAADIGGQPGDWRCIMTKEISLIPDILTHVSCFHHVGLIDAIALGHELGILPEEIFIYAIQPQDLQLSIGLSESVVAAITEISKDILIKLEDLNLEPVPVMHSEERINDNE